MIIGTLSFFIKVRLHVASSWLWYCTVVHPEVKHRRDVLPSILSLLLTLGFELPEKAVAPRFLYILTITFVRTRRNLT